MADATISLGSDVPGTAGATLDIDAAFSAGSDPQVALAEGKAPYPLLDFSFVASYNCERSM